MNKMKEYRITLVIALAIVGTVLLFALVYSFILWLTKSNTLALQWGVFACVAIFISLVVDLSRKPKQEQQTLSKDLIPKGITSTAIPDEEALKEIPIENRLTYKIPEEITKTVPITEQNLTVDSVVIKEQQKLVTN